MKPYWMWKQRMTSKSGCLANLRSEWLVIIKLSSPILHPLRYISVFFSLEFCQLWIECSKLMTVSINSNTTNHNRPTLYHTIQVLNSECCESLLLKLYTGNSVYLASKNCIMITMNLWPIFCSPWKYIP